MKQACTLAGERCGFQCTGYDGQRIWEKRMKITESIKCKTCKIHAVKNESAVHDHTSVGLGKKPYDLKNYKRFIQEVNCVYEACKKDGRC